MTNRERESLRQFRAEEAEFERLAAEERERPIREAVEALKVTHRQLAAVERERLTTVPDPDKWIDDEQVGPGVRMSKTRAAEFNGENARAFRDAHPDLWTPEFVEMASSYFERNSIKLVTTAMLERVAQRFVAAGLLPEKPSEPEPEPVIEQPVVAVAPQPDKQIGIDLLTGEEREFSKWEIDRLSAHDYRKVFKITKARLALPTHAAF